MMKMPLQVNSYGSADFVDDMNQEVFTRVQECVSVYICLCHFFSWVSNPWSLYFIGTLYANSIVLHTFSFKFCNFAKMQAFLFVAGGETCQRIRGTPLRLAQAYILVNARGWRPWCPSIQCSVPLGVGGFFPKIASQRALVARGGFCEFGARSNWPPGMPAMIG